MTQQEMEDLITFSSSLGMSRTKGIVVINGIILEHNFKLKRWTTDIVKERIISYKKEKDVK